MFVYSRIGDPLHAFLAVTPTVPWADPAVTPVAHTNTLTFQHNEGWLQTAAKYVGRSSPCRWTTNASEAGSNRASMWPSVLLSSRHQHGRCDAFGFTVFGVWIFKVTKWAAHTKFKVNIVGSCRNSHSWLLHPDSDLNSRRLRYNITATYTSTNSRTCFFYN